MKRPTARAVTRLVALVALLAASNATVAGAIPGKKTTTTTTTIPKGSTYVALGSSYAAGSGFPDATDACGHSPSNYPHLVAAKLGLNLVEASCGGAVTANLLDTPQGDHPPQLGALTADTRLVTLTVGGNDVGFVTTAFGCANNPDAECTRDAAELDQQFATLASQFDKIYAEIRTRSPKAKIVIATYPRLVTATDCPALQFTPAEATVMGDLGQRLQDVTVAAAKKNKVLVADPYKVGAAHGPCAAADQAWITGAQPIGTTKSTYHPTVAGHAASAVLVEKALAGGAKSAK